MSIRRIIWLASYPKSGNTWTRIFLANLFMPLGQAPDLNHLFKFTTADVRSDFFDRAAGGKFSGGSVNAWLKVRPKALSLIAASKPGHHFVKTHSRIERMQGVDLIPAEVTAAAIYLMRNPFDLVVSYARHMNEPVDTCIVRMTDASAIAGTAAGIFERLGRWDEHIQSWLTAPGLARYVLRYEDMVDDPEQSFRGLVAFLKAPVTDDDLKRALRASSFDTLQREEKLKGFRERPKDMAQFFATGRAGTWREALTDAQVARLAEAFRPTLEQYYPELIAEIT